mgnify:CR=1 FL=1
MLLLRSVPLSFSIFWRFLIVIPFWMLAYIPIMILMVLIAGVSALVPVFGILIAAVVLFALSGMMGMHPLLLATRLGLIVRGIKGEPSKKKLIVAAMGYGVVEGFLGLVVISVGVLGVMLMPGSNVGELFQGAAPRPEMIQQVLTQGIAILVFPLIFIVLGLFRVTLLPVLAGAAAGRDPERNHHTPMNGFGANFLSLLGLMILGMVLVVVFTFLLVTAVFAFGLPGTGIPVDGALPDTVGTFGSFLNRSYLFIAVGNILIWCWVICLQAAGATLSYEARLDKSDKLVRIFGDDTSDADTAKAPVQRHPVDIAELRRSRMQKH